MKQTPKIQTPVKDKVTTIGEGGSRFWLYPASFHGIWLERRRITAYVLILIFFITPWIKINGHQAVLADVADRKLAFFGLVLWPQDTVIFWFFLAGMVVLIFLITAIWGRLWCGWACPQTVFLEHIFRRIEKWIEGEAHQRRRLDAAKWSFTKARKKILKWSLFLIVSSHFANTTLCYFVGTDQVLAMTFQPPTENWGWFLFMGFFNFLFFMDFAWFREQFCIIACPYGRFQSVLLDGDSTIVGYDYNRGEPRGKYHKGEIPTGGDCIDCKRCVVVCPTGIDIRQGLQMECINCTACMDACDEIMDKVERPRGLIRYTALAHLEGRVRKFLRPRVIAYTLVWIGLWSAGAFLLINKQDLIIRMIRPPGVSFTLNEEDARVTNLFQAKATNKSGEDIVLHAEVPDGYELVAAFDPWTIPAQETAVNQVFVRRDKAEFHPSGSEKVAVTFYQEGVIAYQTQVTVMGPRQ